MKKYFFLFAIASCIGIVHASAQTAATTLNGQSAVIVETPSGSETPRPTITKAGKNEQSTVTMPTTTTTDASGQTAPAQQASPSKEQPAIVEPKNRK